MPRTSSRGLACASSAYASVSALRRLRDPAVVVVVAHRAQDARQVVQILAHAPLGLDRQRRRQVVVRERHQPTRPFELLDRVGAPLRDAVERQLGLQHVARRDARDLRVGQVEVEPRDRTRSSPSSPRTRSALRSETIATHPGGRLHAERQRLPARERHHDVGLERARRARSRTCRRRPPPPRAPRGTDRCPGSDRARGGRTRASSRTPPCPSAPAVSRSRSRSRERVALRQARARGGLGRQPDGFGVTCQLRELGEA